MKLKKHIKKIMAVGCIALLGATMAGCADVKLSTQEYNQAIENAKAEGKASVDITTDNAQAIADAVAAVDITSDNDKAVEDAISTLTKDQVPDPIQEQIIADAAEAQDKVDADTEAKGYTLDELKIGLAFERTLSDREINLFDGEVEFDGDDYDAEEVLYLNLKIAANEEEDWNTDTFLQAKEGGITYVLKFASDLKTDFIGNEVEDCDCEDETLIFDLLGEEVEVDDWDGTEVTFTKGEEFEFIEGQEQTIDDRKVKVSIIHVVDDTGYVKVYVDGIGRKIYEGSTRTVNGIEIRVVEVSVNDETDDEALLEIGEEVEISVKNGEEYAKDSIWEWAITPNSIGLTLVEEHISIDEDEDFKALAVGDEICLPNEYVCVTYNGLTVEDTEDYDFELKKKNDVDYVMVRGEFIDGIEDYDKIYINRSGSILDDDFELIGDDNSIELADTDLTLEISGRRITIEDIENTVLFETNHVLDKLEADETSIATEDEDYITNYGIVVKDPDDNLEDNEIEIVVPEEALEAEIFITSK